MADVLVIAIAAATTKILILTFAPPVLVKLIQKTAAALGCSLYLFGLRYYHWPGISLANGEQIPDQQPEAGNCDDAPDFTPVHALHEPVGSLCRKVRRPPG